MKHQLFLALAESRKVDPRKFRIVFGQSSLGATDADTKLEKLVGQPSMRPASFDPPVEVRDCGSRGVGVFATRGISSGEVATYYAGRVVKLADAGFLDYGESLFGSRRFSLGGDPRCMDPRACGQLVNDPHAIAPTREEADAFWDVSGQLALLQLQGQPVPTSMSAESWLEVLAHVAVYTHEARLHQNCLYGYEWGPGDTIIGKITAKRDIPAGSELLMSYGPMYWLSRALQLTSKALAPPEWLMELHSEAVSTVDIDNIDPGPGHLPTIILVLGEVEWFKAQRELHPFVDTSLYLMAQMAADSWANGKSHFSVDEFMSKWRALRDSGTAW